MIISVLGKPRIYKRAVYSTALFLFITCSPLLAQSLGLWVIRDQLTSRAKIDEFINFARQNNIHHLFVQVRGRGDAFYNSKIVTSNELLTDRSWDPLEYTLTRAHEQGLKVHAWINVFLLWSAEQKPNDPMHLLNVHPEWCSVDEDGIKDSERPFEEFQKQNTEGIYLSPLVPEVRRYLLDVIREVVHNYPVDGIHLDYIRYPNNKYDYNVIGRLMFKERHGIDPILLAISNKTIMEQLNATWPIQEYLTKWDDFRRESVNIFIRTVNTMLRQTAPPVQLSAAVKPDPDEARHFFFQDWEQWLKQDLLNFVVLMNYAKNDGQFERCLQRIDKQLPKQKIWVGISVYNQTNINALQKIAVTYSYRFPNIVFFSYETFQKDPSYFPQLRAALSTGR